MTLKDEAEGTAKEVQGKVTGDESREAEGKLEQAMGKAKDLVEDAKDAAGNLVDRARDEIAERRGDSDPAPDVRR